MNSRFLKTVLYALAIFSVLTASAARSQAGPPGKDESVITVEGQAPGVNGNAAEQAKQDALRKAVERACGTFISSQTKTENYAAIYDKAMSFAAGYVTQFTVLQRRTADGMSYCKVRATVSRASFQKEWARLRHTIEAEGNPRCIVVMVEDDNVDDDIPPKTNGVTQAIVEDFFLNKGVQLMDKGASEDSRSRDISLAALNDDVNKLAAMAASFKADVVIRGNAQARQAGTTQMGGRTLYKWTATLNVRAYHTDSAQMLMSKTYSAAKTTSNQNAGGDEVLRKCASQNVPRMLGDVGEAWRKRQNIRRVCQVTIENCTRRDYKAFEAALREVTGVQGVRLKELVNNVCQVEVDWTYDLERLVRRIEALKVPNAAYEVTEQTHDRVTLKLVK